MKLAVILATLIATVSCTIGPYSYGLAGRSLIGYQQAIGIPYGYRSALALSPYRSIGNAGLGSSLYQRSLLGYGSRGILGAGISRAGFGLQRLGYGIGPNIGLGYAGISGYQGIGAAAGYSRLGVGYSRMPAFSSLSYGSYLRPSYSSIRPSYALSSLAYRPLSIGMGSRKYRGASAYARPFALSSYAQPLALSSYAQPLALGSYYGSSKYDYD